MDALCISLHVFCVCVFLKVLVCVVLAKHHTCNLYDLCYFPLYYMYCSFIWLFISVYFGILSFISVEVLTATNSPEKSITWLCDLYFIFFPSKPILPFSSQNAEAIMSSSINPTFWHFTLEEEFSCQAITASEPRRHELWARAYTKP